MQEISILFNRVLVKKLDERFLESEILLLTDEEEPLMGEVLVLGDGRDPKTGKVHPFDVKIGDKVMFSAHVGEKLPQGLLMREDDILGIIE